MERVDLSLQNIIYNLIGDLSESSIHYLVKTRYFLYYDRRTHYAPIHFHKNNVDNIEILEEGIRCKFALGPEFDDEKFIIKIYYRHISKVSKYRNAGFHEEEILFVK